MPGETPVVSFRVSNPLTDEPYDILNDPEFTGEGARLAVGVAWNTLDYTNTGNGADNASQIQANALSSAMPNGDGSFSVSMPLALPDGSDSPFVPATGSGVAAVEGHPVVAIEGEPAEIPVGDATRFFSIDEADGLPVPRRQSVALDNCLSCHSTLVLHGNNRADNIDSCVSCHNPRNTDRRVREVALDPPTDGKDEESIDFKTMIHGIHAPAIREMPLEIVGFGGFSTTGIPKRKSTIREIWPTAPPATRRTASGCHGRRRTGHNDGYWRRPADPADDTVTTPVTAVCASCHDGAEAGAHMVAQGGSFATSQAAIDDGTVIETCNTCHGSGRSADVAVLHGLR